MFSRGEKPKSDKGSLHRMNIKEKMRIYLNRVINILRKGMLQRL